MLLSGHDGDIYCTKFAPSGQFLASAGFDRLICTLTLYYILAQSVARVGYQSTLYMLLHVNSIP